MISVVLMIFPWASLDFGGTKGSTDSLKSNRATPGPKAFYSNSNNNNNNNNNNSNSMSTFFLRFFLLGGVYFWKHSTIDRIPEESGVVAKSRGRAPSAVYVQQGKNSDSGTEAPWVGSFANNATEASLHQALEKKIAIYRGECMLIFKEYPWRFGMFTLNCF